MTMAGMWTRERTLQLINLYEENNLLWNSRSPSYRNKSKRKEALEQIAQQIGKSIPGLTVEDIKNKINGIRTQYVSELNRVLSAKAKNESFEPTLWFFDRISFLKSFTQPKIHNSTKIFNPSNETDEKLNKKDNKEYILYRLQTKSKNSNKDQLIELEIDSNDALLPFLYHENSLDDQDQKCSDLNTSNKEERSTNTDDFHEEHEDKQESNNDEDGSEISSSNRIKTEVSEEYCSDGEVYIIEDEQYTIDQDGNRVKYDNKGNRTYISDDKISSTPKNVQNKISKPVNTFENAVRETTSKNLDSPSTSNYNEPRGGKRKNFSSEPNSTSEKHVRYEPMEPTKEDIYRNTEVFGNYVTEQLRVLKSEEMRLTAQHKITKLLLELQEKQIDDMRHRRDDSNDH